MNNDMNKSTNNEQFNEANIDTHECCEAGGCHGNAEQPYELEVMLKEIAAEEDDDGDETDDDDDDGMDAAGLGQFFGQSPYSGMPDGDDDAEEAEHDMLYHLESMANNLGMTLVPIHPATANNPDFRPDNGCCHCGDRCGNTEGNICGQSHDHMADMFNTIMESQENLARLINGLTKKVEAHDHRMGELTQASTQGLINATIDSVSKICADVEDSVCHAVKRHSKKQASRVIEEVYRTSTGVLRTLRTVKTKKKK